MGLVHTVPGGRAIVCDGTCDRCRRLQRGHNIGEALAYLHGYVRGAGNSWVLPAPVVKRPSQADVRSNQDNASIVPMLHVRLLGLPGVIVSPYLPDGRRILKRRLDAGVVYKGRSRNGVPVLVRVGARVMVDDYAGVIRLRVLPPGYWHRTNARGSSGANRTRVTTGERK